jgi:hypothetical protein
MTLNPITEKVNSCRVAYTDSSGKTIKDYVLLSANITVTKGPK